MIKEKYKYSPFIEYGGQLESIIQEKKYDEASSNMLRLVFPIMIEYYGDQYKDILFDTLRQISIEKPMESETMYDIVKKYTPNNIDKRSQISAVNEGELKRASGVHSMNPILEVVDGKIKLVGKSEVVSIKENTNKIDMIATFVHELSHAIKSNQNSINLLEDKEGNQILLTRSGISIVYSKVFLENGKIVVEDIKENNVGMEEGINTYDENVIMNRILSFPKDRIPSACQELRDSLKLPDTKKEYISAGYVQETLCADKLLNRCNLKEKIREDQFIGTNKSEKAYNEFSNSIDNNWKQLNKKVDLSVSHTYERYKHFGDVEWIHGKMPEIMANLREIHEMLDKTSQNNDRDNIKNL